MEYINCILSFIYKIILDTFFRWFILGTIYLSNLYGKENVYFYKI